MNEQIPQAKVSLDEYARLTDAVGKSGVDTLILPGGGAEALERHLTCQYGHGWRCGDFVCYKHNPELRPVADEQTTLLPSPLGNKWSRPIPTRVLTPFVDGLVVVP